MDILSNRGALLLKKVLLSHRYKSCQANDNVNGSTISIHSSKLSLHSPPNTPPLFCPFSCMLERIGVIKMSICSHVWDESAKGLSGKELSGKE